jgi:hypothetical protein
MNWCSLIGHKSKKDGRYYLLDFARYHPLGLLFICYSSLCLIIRTMPPQKLVRRGKSDKVRRHLFELLRPELVISNAEPLSSDAYSLFSQNDPEFHDLNGHVCFNLFAYDSWLPLML